MSAQSLPPKKRGNGTMLKAFLTGAILAASALVGGVAVVLWNRKALSGLRHHPQPNQKPSEDADETAG